MTRFRMIAAAIALVLLLVVNVGVFVAPALGVESSTPCTDKFGGSEETYGEWCGCMWALYGYECTGTYPI